MSANFDALSAQVDVSNSIAAIAASALTDLVGHVTTLAAQIADLTAQLAAAHTEDPAAVDGLTTKLKIASDALQAAVSAVPAPAPAV